MLTSLAAQHKGGSTAKQHLEILSREHEEGVLDLESIRAAGRALWEKDRGFWKGWRKDQDDATRDKMKTVGLCSVEQEAENKPSSGTLTEASAQLDELKNPKNLGKLVGQAMKKLNEPEKAIFAARVEEWCRKNHCEDKLEGLKDLKPYRSKM